MANVAWSIGVAALLVGQVAWAEPDALTPEQSGRRRYEAGDLPKQMTVVQTPKAPVINGIMDPGEWDAAAAISGLTVGESGYVFGYLNGKGLEMGNVAADQSRFWVTYDDENLYIAHHSPPPARIAGDTALIPVMLKSAVTQQDSNIDWDDCIRFSILEPGAEQPGEFKIYVNSKGVTHEFITGGGKASTLAGINLGWNPRVKSGSTLTLEGWTIEVAVPWADFGPLVKQPAPGETLRMNFSRLWREILKEDHNWALWDKPAVAAEASGYGVYFWPAGEVRFAGDEGVVVQLLETGNPARGQAVFKAVLRNLSKTGRTLKVSVATDSNEIRETQDVTLEPGEARPFEYAGRIVDLATTTLAFTVADAAGGAPLHATTLPVIRSTKPEFFVRRLRSPELTQFEVDIGFLGAVEPEQVRIDLELVRKADGQKIVSRSDKDFTSYEPVIELSTMDWHPGEYEARFVFHAPGRAPVHATVDYIHPAIPEWWHNRHGFEDMDQDQVPYPWTDMKVADDKVQVWGREYGFGKGLYPEQITTQGAALLRAPIRLLVKTAEGQTLDTAAATAAGEWTKTARTRVEGARSVDAGAYSLRNDVWVEYDGLMWSTLTIQPKGKTKIAAMELEIPLSKAFSDVINTYDYALLGTGKLKPEGFTGPVMPIWLGNGDGGLQWFCETDGWFFTRDNQEIVRVENTPEGATLRIVMIDLPTEFEQPHTMSFGLMPTPVRPKVTRTPAFNPASIIGGGPWFPKGFEFMPAADPGSDSYGGVRGGRIYVHLSPVNIGVTNDAAGTDYKLFADEWRSTQSDRNMGTIQTTQASRSFRDFFVWRHWRYQHKYGYGGLYYDAPTEVISANPFAGAGYARRDGSRASTQPILGTREILKRLYNVTLSNPALESGDAPIGVHQSGRPNMAYLGFGTYSWDGENFASIINDKQPTYRGVMNPALFRAQLMGHNFGWPTTFLGQAFLNPERVLANEGPEAATDLVHGLELLHDAPLTGWLYPSRHPLPMYRVVERTTNAYKRYDLGHWLYQFTPYWKQSLVTLPGEKQYASWYIARPSALAKHGDVEWHRRSVYNSYFDPHLPWHIQGRNGQVVARDMEMIKAMPDKAVLIVYNDSDWEGEMRLKPDWAELGIGAPETLKATNAVHSTGFRLEKGKNDKDEEVWTPLFFDRPEEFAKIENCELVFPMTKFNYRMIVIEKGK